MEHLDPVLPARVVAGMAVLAGMVASTASCIGKSSNASSATQPPMTTTITIPRGRRLRKAIYTVGAATSATDGNPRRQRNTR
jgi:hypothetical protein